MRPDQPIIEEEARDFVKRSLRQYARDQSARDVALFGASRRMDWNELQSAAGLSPARLSRRIRKVRTYLQAAIQRRASDPSP